MQVQCCSFVFVFVKQERAYEVRISDWSSDVCSSDLPLFGHARDLPPFGSNGVDFINEENAGRGLCGGLEYFAKLLFGLAIGRADDFRTVNQEKFCIAFICHGAGVAGLSCAGRAVEQHTPGPIGRANVWTSITNETIVISILLG